MRHDDTLIHRLLDGDLPADLREEALRSVAGDPALQAEFERLAAAVDLLERKGPLKAPAGFTAATMRRIPAPCPSRAGRLREFFFARRVMRWNVASAMAGVVLVLGALVLAYHAGGPGVRSAPSAAADAPVTLRLSLYAPRVHEVSVVGDFNRWTVGKDPMSRSDGGIWTISLSLRPGRYSYMFVLDGKRWMTDPGADAYQDDGFGNKNAVVRIGTKGA